MHVFSPHLFSPPPSPEASATISIADGDVVCVRYRCIQALVEAGDLQLI